MSRIEFMPSANITVIICSHNPRPDYLRRTLDALKSQTLPQSQWEFLLVDNASKEPLSKTWDLSWHVNGRHVLENDLGLTPARLTAIRESKGELLVFVDDDNLLAKDYLSQASELFTKRSDLGVASGRIMPEYETPPPEWFGPHESWIAVRRIEQSRWSNFFDPRAEPCGAGMCLRKSIAVSYAQKARANKRQQLLGRRGNSLLSGEDVAISKVALGMGYSMGQFVELNLTHIIPSRRVTESYLFSLYCNLVASGKLISWMEEPDQKPASITNWRVLAKAALRFIKGNRVERRLVIEDFRAASLVRKIISEAEQKPVNVASVATQKL